MRILYSHRTQSRDGQSVHIEEIVAALRSDQHEVLVVGPAFYDHAAFGKESGLIALLRRCLPPGLGEVAELVYNLPAYVRLRRAARAFRPDMIYERYNLFYLAGTWLARRQKLPFILEVNSPLAAERRLFGGNHLRRLSQMVEKRVWQSADQVFAVSAVLRDTIAYAGVPASRISVVPNAIDPARFVPAVPFVSRSSLLVLGFIGFVRSWHGLDMVIAAMAADADRKLTLTIVGEGPARPALEQQAHQLGIASRVCFTGLTNREDVPRILAGFDIALQPKAVPYASPLKLFEYMAAGRAIVAPDQPNIREILQHERTALLFDPSKPHSLWQAVRRLADDAALRRSLGEAAREQIFHRDYTWHGNARRIVTMGSAIAARSEAGRACSKLGTRGKNAAE